MRWFHGARRVQGRGQAARAMISATWPRARAGGAADCPRRCTNQCAPNAAAKRTQPGTRMRVGGLVKPGTVERGANLQISFSVTDGKTDVPVRYQGIVPDLFREGQGVIAEGKLESDGKLTADTVLAKHDERYMPREVVDALKKSGHWQEGEAKPQEGAKR